MAILKVDTSIPFMIDGFLSGMRPKFWLFYGPYEASIA